MSRSRHGGGQDVQLVPHVREAGDAPDGVRRHRTGLVAGNGASQGHRPALGVQQDGGPVEPLCGAQGKVGVLGDRHVGAGRGLGSQDGDEGGEQDGQTGSEAHGEPPRGWGVCL